MQVVIRKITRQRDDVPVSFIDNKTLEYSETYYKRIAINYDEKSNEYFYIRFVGFIERYLNIVVFQDGSYNVYYVTPDYEAERGHPYSQIGKTTVVNKKPFCGDIIKKLEKELSNGSDTIKLIAKDFLSGSTIKFISKEIIDFGFPNRIY